MYRETGSRMSLYPKTNQRVCVGAEMIGPELSDKPVRSSFYYNAMTFASDFPSPQKKPEPEGTGSP